MSRRWPRPRPLPRESRCNDEYPRDCAERTEVVLRVADRLHRDRILGAALRMVLRVHPELLPAPEPADGPVRHAGAAVDERESAAGAAAAAERHDPRALPHADG